MDANAYYATAVYWARMNGIVAGYSDERFGPNDTITREQMATILYRYAQYKVYDTTDKANLSKFLRGGGHPLGQRRGPGLRHQRYHFDARRLRHPGAGGGDPDPVLPEYRKVTRAGIAPYKQ